MISKNEIDRINVLYRKSQTEEGLSVEEKEEQQILRRKYIDSVKANLRSSLNNIDILESDGSVTKLNTKENKH